ncbi:oligopeptide/dipeptide ABC transporter ATP-binding protein [Arthrobacter ginsengisoli]|uniref:Oligopeptide/dipeptide ABC transporter ATP-binding protein n=1 Tax=Arthrobacter ginsengisoli TaxID=1356565 RepID=A0ABU1UG40_9MICC|nr:oligopeptide/dipeptide ABC transporter ATP-binding protein [Arthrobacter ginsengisoli]MDR7084142.1 oligopeptide/dipeptide ABC transporter ATP-binding protein [Arthrobacter ginsengisoli]
MSQQPVLEVTGLEVNFAGKKKAFGRAAPIRAVKGVSFSIQPGETLGLVGESGSGKSTVARAVMQLIEPAAGEVLLKGREITALRGKELRVTRRDIQMVFQDPYSSLDPSMLIADSVGEALEVHDGLRGHERDARVAELLELVGLSSHHLERYPYEFSGGQRQRIAIARALALNPAVVVCDEAVSALDVSTQNQIIGLLEGLREKLNVAYLFISHDLAVVRHISDRVAVMYFGHLVEVGEVSQIFERPAHPYTRALLSAIPIADPLRQRSRKTAMLTGEIPDIVNPPSGCPFASRCEFASGMCREQMPEFREHNGSSVACHHPLQT